MKQCNPAILLSKICGFPTPPHDELGFEKYEEKLLVCGCIYIPLDDLPSTHSMGEIYYRIMSILPITEIRK